MRFDDRIGRFVPVDGEQFAQAFLAVQLDRSVPEEVQQMFATARGAILYGWFYYPMYTLGLEHLWRTAELALAIRYQREGGPKRIEHRVSAGGRERVVKRTALYETRIAWLAEREILAADDAERWHRYRDLRNAASHPEFQAIYMPSDARFWLARLAEGIERVVST